MNYLNPFKLVFNVIGFFVKLVGFFIMFFTLVTGALMSIALFFGFKKFAPKHKPVKKQPSETPEKTTETFGVIDIKAEEVETI